MVKPEEMVVLDRWAVGCAKAAQEDILNAYGSIRFPRSGTASDALLLR
ncbi:hypothetical protein ACP0HM_28990 [Escherichia coli]